MYALTAGHPTLPMPSYAYVTNLQNGRTVLVRINDRGPYARDRLIDLSYQTAHTLGFHNHGLARVRVRYAGRAPLNGDDSAERRYLAAQSMVRRQPSASRKTARRRSPPARSASVRTVDIRPTYPQPQAPTWSVNAVSPRGAGERAPGRIDPHQAGRRHLFARRSVHDARGRRAAAFHAGRSRRTASSRPQEAAMIRHSACGWAPTTTRTPHRPWRESSAAGFEPEASVETGPRDGELQALT